MMNIIKAVCVIVSIIVAVIASNVLADAMYKANECKRATNLYIHVDKKANATEHNVRLLSIVSPDRIDEINELREQANELREQANELREQANELREQAGITAI